MYYTYSPTAFPFTAFSAKSCYLYSIDSSQLGAKVDNLVLD